MEVKTINGYDIKDETARNSIDEINNTLSNIQNTIKIDNVTTNKYYDNTSSTTYYITEIPYQNEDGTKNIFHIGTGNDNVTTLTDTESTIDFARRKLASVCINGGLFQRSTQTYKPHGVLIKDNVVLQDELSTLSDTYILGIKEDGSFQVFDATTTNAQTVLNGGCVNALVGYGTLIQGGISIINTSDTVNPRQVLGRKTNGDYLIFTCEGRTSTDLGMTISDVQRILQSYGNVDFAFELDGGGSTSTVINLQKINKNIDNTDRSVENFLYISKANTNEIINDLYTLISNLSETLNTFHDVWYGYLKLYSNQSHPGIEFYQDNETEERTGKLSLNYDGFSVNQRNGLGEDERNLFSVTDSYIRYLGVPFGSFYNYITNPSDLNDIDRTGFYFATNNTSNTPKAGNFLILNLINTENNSNNKEQYAFPFHSNNGYIYTRRATDGSSGVFGDWQPVGLFSSTTANRPTTSLKTGACYFDTTLGKPIWYDGTNWVDATGTQV